MPAWLWIPMIMFLQSLACWLCYRRGFIKGLRNGKIKWRCKYCPTILYGEPGDPILKAALAHLDKEHLENGFVPVPAPEEGGK